MHAATQTDPEGFRLKGVGGARFQRLHTILEKEALTNADRKPGTGGGTASKERGGMLL